MWTNDQTSARLKPRGRFAPTPSGRMHLGNALCALLAWLSIRSKGGEMVLRIEDLDPGRCKKEYACQLEDDLRWLGLDWEEGGCTQTGLHAPYLQSERSALYEQMLGCLDAQGLVYPCYCSRAELHAVSAPHRGDGSQTYSGHCRIIHLPNPTGDRQPSIRLAVPNEEILFIDGHMGEYRENLARDCGDFIVRRADGVFAYQLAVVADDGLMEITEVTRGSDLLSSTPRQLYLYRLFGLTPPVFYHLPLLLAPDGRRLSKRDRDLDFGVLRCRCPDASRLVGQLAHLCGLLPIAEAITPRELIPLFAWDKISRQDIILPEHRNILR